MPRWTINGRAGHVCGRHLRYGRWGWLSVALAVPAFALQAAAAPLQPAATSATSAPTATSATSAPAVHAVPKVPVFPHDAALLAAFGGREGVFKLADLLVVRMKADARIGRYFDKTKLPALKDSLGQHLCAVLAGPCVYEGDDMKAAHADMGITRADSLVQVELLQDCMRELGVPFRAQNQLLARLAPMYRDVIER